MVDTDWSVQVKQLRKSTGDIHSLTLFADIYMKTRNFSRLGHLKIIIIGYLGIYNFSLNHPVNRSLPASIDLYWFRSNVTGVSIDKNRSASEDHQLRQYLITTAFCLLAGIANAQELLLYGGEDHVEFLGCLNCSKYDSDSICNEYGKGSAYNSDSIFNEYGTYGSEYSSSSPWNSYTSSDSVPVLVNPDGNFYGYLTINEYRGDAVDFADNLADIFETVDGDLELVQKIICKWF